MWHKGVVGFPDPARGDYDSNDGDDDDDDGEHENGDILGVIIMVSLHSSKDFMDKISSTKYLTFRQNISEKMQIQICIQIQIQEYKYKINWHQVNLATLQTQG